MRPPTLSQLVNVTQSVMPTYMQTMTAPTTYQTMLTPASATSVVSTAATYQQQQAAMLAALQLQQLSMLYLTLSVILSLLIAVHGRHSAFIPLFMYMYIVLAETCARAGSGVLIGKMAETHKRTKS